MKKPKTINRPFAPNETRPAATKQNRIAQRERTSFYHTWKWRKTSEAFRAMPGNEFCEYCKAKGTYTATQCADHNPPLPILLRQGNDPYNYKYLVPSCNKCNLSKGSSDRKQINKF